MYKILVVDDEPKIREVIREYSEFNGHEVTEASDGMMALGLCKLNDYDLIIMDIMMPKLDGMQATMRIREEKNIPIIMLSAKSEDYDKITGLNVGADDYITKPFNPLELIARVKSQIRRYTNLGSLAGTEAKNVFKTGGLVIDDSTKQVMVDGEEVDEKIVAVPLRDPAFSCFNDVSELPKHTTEEIENFFKVYKTLEHTKETQVQTAVGHEEAIRVIAHCMEEYRLHYCGKR